MAGEGEAIVGVFDESCQRLAGRPAVLRVEKTEIRQGKRCYVCDSIALFCVARQRSVLPVGWRQLGVGREMIRSFAHAEMEFGRFDAHARHARIGGVHSMLSQAVAKTWGRPARLLHRLPVLGSDCS